MENLLVKKKIARNQDGTYHVDWFPVNEEIENMVIHGKDFHDKSEIIEYEMQAHIEMVNCINEYFGQPLYQVNADSVEHSLYIKRRDDGRRMVDGLMAELRNKSIELGLPENVNRTIESRLLSVKQNVETGWFKTALNECSHLVADDVLTQELIDRITGVIQNYVNENYSTVFV